MTTTDELNSKILDILTDNSKLFDDALLNLKTPPKYESIEYSEYVINLQSKVSSVCEEINSTIRNTYKLSKSEFIDFRINAIFKEHSQSTSGIDIEKLRRDYHVVHATRTRCNLSDFSSGILETREKLLPGGVRYFYSVFALEI